MFRSGHCLQTVIPGLKMTDIVLRSSGTICLSAIINRKNDRLSRDVFFAIAIDIFCCVLHLVFHIFMLSLSLL